MVRPLRATLVPCSLPSSKIAERALRRLVVEVGVAARDRLVERVIRIGKHQVVGTHQAVPPVAHFRAAPQVDPCELEDVGGLLGAAGHDLELDRRWWLGCRRGPGGGDRRHRTLDPVRTRRESLA